MKKISLICITLIMMLSGTIFAGDESMGYNRTSILACKNDSASDECTKALERLGNACEGQEEDSDDCVAYRNHTACVQDPASRQCSQVSGEDGI